LTMVTSSCETTKPKLVATMIQLMEADVLVMTEYYRLSRADRSSAAELFRPDPCMGAPAPSRRTPQSCHAAAILFIAG
jgi:hypothetical protein